MPSTSMRLPGRAFCVTGEQSDPRSGEQYSAVWQSVKQFFGNAGADSDINVFAKVKCLLLTTVPSVMFTVSSLCRGAGYKNTNAEILAQFEEEEPPQWPRHTFACLMDSIGTFLWDQCQQKLRNNCKAICQS